VKEVEDRVANATNANLDVDWPVLGAINANQRSESGMAESLRVIYSETQLLLL
jgi:hypothetical protein